MDGEKFLVLNLPAAFTCTWYLRMLQEPYPVVSQCTETEFLMQPARLAPKLPSNVFIICLLSSGWPWNRLPQGTLGRYIRVTDDPWMVPTHHIWGQPGQHTGAILAVHLTWTPSYLPAQGLCIYHIFCLEAPLLLYSHLALCWPSGLGFNLFFSRGPHWPLPGWDPPVILMISWHWSQCMIIN